VAQLTTTNQAALPKRKKTKRRPGAFRAVTTTDYQHRLANLVHFPFGQTKWKIDLGRHAGRCPPNNRTPTPPGWTLSTLHLGKLVQASWPNGSQPTLGKRATGPTSNRRTTPLGEPVPLPICTTLSRPCGQMENRPPWRVRANPKELPQRIPLANPSSSTTFHTLGPTNDPDHHQTLV